MDYFLRKEKSSLIRKEDSKFLTFQLVFTASLIPG